jgi:signal transduction histidine kinase
MSTLDTWYASPVRADAAEIERDLAILTASPFMGQLLRAADGMFAVLNRHRQVLAVNDALLERVGLQDDAETLGLRVGEVLDCVHAGAAPSGCGTGRLCRSCGAAIAIVASLAEEAPVQRDCALSSVVDGAPVEVFLRVRSVATTVADRRFVFLFLQDATREHRQAALERLFLHDLSNIAQGLLGSAEVLVEAVGSAEDHELCRTVLLHAEWLTDEIALHRTLCQLEAGDLQLSIRPVELGQILRQLQASFSHHPQAQGKVIAIEEPDGLGTLETGITALRRVLNNMLTNALEAEPPGARVLVRARPVEAGVRVEVHNPSAIPEPAQDRIFQRHFSTKGALGRGLGTYSMKLFGERVLGGRVGFRSSPQQGTTFWIDLPSSAGAQGT